ncbi:hypothetical protein BDP27DRAFT_1365554 [Rhodocollybia butyracea]|uniref:Uncharacterized protein n=1 Tax=Rhodocollybia butyracea TaxID=206335 RepID=A0A9P5PNH6_9AGAR|nr:hypothetical protein BDP27DRAFT_1365554 [Rhodocollybia butyracea]
MVQLSETLLTAINQTAHALIDHVATADQVLLSDQSRIREWLHGFGYVVAKYLGVVRIIAAETGLPYANPDQARTLDYFQKNHDKCAVRTLVGTIVFFDVAHQARILHAGCV